MLTSNRYFQKRSDRCKACTIFNQKKIIKARKRVEIFVNEVRFANLLNTKIEREVHGKGE